MQILTILHKKTIDNLRSSLPLGAIALPPRREKTPPPPEWDDATVAIATKRAKIELDLVGGVLADPAEGLLFAERAGVNHSMIDDQGLWIIYAVVIACRDLGKFTRDKSEDAMTVATLSKAALIQATLWDSDDQRPWLHPPAFSPESMAALLNSWPSTAMVGRMGRQLVDITARIEKAQEHLSAAMQLIQEVA